VQGQSASLTAQRAVVTTPATVPVEGQDATLTAARDITAAPGTVAITGQEATLTYTLAGATYELEVDPASVLVLGSSATIEVIPAVQRKPGASSGRYHRKSRYWIRVYDDPPPAPLPKKRESVVVKLPRPVAKPTPVEPYDDTDDLVAVLLLAA